MANSLSEATFFDVNVFLDERPMALAQWLILTLCFLVLIADGFDTAAMSFVAPALGSELLISRLALGPVLSAALVGLAAGALIAGPLADRFGRKRIILASVILFSLWTLATASAGTVATLAVCRFFTGFGIGAAMPNCTTLVSEFIPARRRSFLVNLMFVGFPLGASLGGFVASALIPRFGWRSVFLAGGSAPLLLAALLFFLPESVSFMVARQWPLHAIKSALNRLAAHDPESLARIAAATHFRTHETSAARSGSPLTLILSSNYRFATFMLWTAYFMGLLLYYLLTSWMPTFIRDAGHTIAEAARITALFPLGGGIGALLCGWLMDRTNATRVVSAAYLLTAVLLVALSRSTHSIGPFMIVTLLAGVAMNGAQTSMLVLSATTYPTLARASGVAWMLGIGRFGGILGALSGGALLALGYHLSTILLGLAAVAVLAAAALLLKAQARQSAIAPNF